MKTKYLLNIAVLLLFLFGLINAGYAATCIVTKATDSNDGICDADCSLREAAASCGTVVFSTILSGPTPIVLTLGEIQLNGTTIIGPGANQLTISGNSASRIFYVTTASSVSISGVTLTSGNGVGTGGISGGAIRSDGTLRLNSVHITGNSVTAKSGASNGGGVYLSRGGNVILNSAFSDNSASTLGSAVYQSPDSLTIYNSTFAGNFGGGGAIAVVGTNVTVRNVTITGNTAGINVGGLSGLSFGNSIIAGNSGYDISRASMNSAATSAGNNIIGNTSNAGNPVTFHSSDILNVVPTLGVLQDNGGTTPTMALPGGSPAIDAGSNALANAAGLSFDQRGFNRIVDGNGDANAVVDIGAYEYLSSAGTISLSGRVTNFAGRPVSKAHVTLRDAGGNTRIALINPFGYYAFVNVPAGRDYTINVAAKNAQFAQISIFASQNFSNIDFIAQ